MPGRYEREMEWENNHIVWCSTAKGRAIFLCDEEKLLVRPQAMNSFRAVRLRNRMRTVMPEHKFHVVKLWRRGL